MKSNSNAFFLTCAVMSMYLTIFFVCVVVWCLLCSLSIICDSLTVAQESIQGRLTSEDRHSLESQVPLFSSRGGARILGQWVRCFSKGELGRRDCFVNQVCGSRSKLDSYRIQELCGSGFVFRIRIRIHTFKNRINSTVNTGKKQKV